MPTLAAEVAVEEGWSELHGLARLLDYPTHETADLFGIDLLPLENHYISLFANRAGGVPAPPYAGHYLKNVSRLEFMQQIVGQAHAQGIEIDMSQPPDYIPMMLEMLCYGRLQYGESWPEFRAALRSFFQSWPEEFAAALQEHDSIGMYAEVSARVRDLVSHLITQE